MPENEQATTKDDFIHIIDYLQKEKKIKQTTFPANTHSPAPTANNWLLTGQQPAHAQVRQSRDRDNNNNTKSKKNNNSNTDDNVYGAVIMTNCKSSPGSFDECLLSAANRQSKPTDLGCESAGRLCYATVVAA